MKLSDLTHTKELERRAAAHLAHAIANDSYYSNDPVREMQRRGFKAYEVHTKAAVAAVTVEDVGVALAPLAAATLEQTVRGSLLGQLDGVQIFGLTDFLRVQGGRIVGHVVAEGVSKPVSTVSFTEAGGPVKAAAQIVASTEFIRAIDEQTQAALTRQLTGAAAVALSEAMLTAMQTAAGAPEADATPSTLLAALGQAIRPALVGGFDALAPLAGTLRDLQALGVQVVIAPGAAGFLYAVDAARVAVAISQPIIQVAREAVVLLDDGGSPTVTTTINLYQENATAIRSELFARFAIAPGAVAYGALGSPA